MLFSEYFNIRPTPDDQWFDPLLSIDTPLFLDPFLLYATEEGNFVGSHAEVIAFFNCMFQLIARAQGNTRSALYQKAVNNLVFPEVAELCLGYTEGGTRGSGSGRGFARVIADALWEAIQAGIVEITHFEEIGIIREGIGADRISDITAGLLRHRLASYTSEICRRHNIPLETFRYVRGRYDVGRELWLPIELQLPRNPFSGKAVLLLPRRYLRDLPTINADDFWDYSYTNENETLRNEFSQDITRNVSKREIVELGRRHPEFLENYLHSTERSFPRPYDSRLDPRGYVQWYYASGAYCQRYPMQFVVEHDADFVGVVQRMVEAYRHFIEENAGWQLLWNDNRTNKSEKAAQLLFLGIVKHYCQANDIDISPEVNIGRGPVDFKVARGFSSRALLELKLARNTKFWNGLRRQLPTYMNAEGITRAYFIVIVFNEMDFERLRMIQEVTARVNQSTGYDITTVVVDATYGRPSASRL